MEWIRGITIGRGTFGTVNLAIPTSSDDQLMVVKSSDVSTSDSLQNEREILSRLGNRCPQIIRWIGDDITTENGGRLYNLFLEYASGGSLSDHVKRNRVSEFEVRRFANSILRGLCFIHDSGIVHCDIKLENILLFEDGDVKISDFGLATEVNKKSGGFELRGTPMYMSPELVGGEGPNFPADVWAFGCAVLELLTGKSAWKCEPGCGVPEFLCLIGAGKKSPEIPDSLSEEGKDFLGKCFVNDPNERWTTRMLLDHPFVSGQVLVLVKDKPSTNSPRCPFEFADYSPKYDISDAYYSLQCNEEDDDEPSFDSIMEAMERVQQLTGNPKQEPDWSDSDSWISVR